MELNPRQKEIIEIVRKKEPITANDIGEILSISTATIRPDLALLKKVGILDARPRVGYYYCGKATDREVLREIGEVSVQEWMSLPVVLDESVSVYDAVITIFLEDVSTLYLTSDGFLSGVVSRKDLLRAAIGGTDLQNTPVGVVMSRMPGITTIRKDDSMIEAARRLVYRSVDSLPVVEEEDGGLRILGRITKTNMTKYLAEIMEG